MTDPFKDDPTVVAWAKNVLDDMVPKMKDSAIVAQIIPDTEEYGPGDVKFWVELGATIMMDKPVIAVAFDQRTVPEKLRLIADRIVYCPEGVGPECVDRLQEAMNEVMRERGLE